MGKNFDFLHQEETAVLRPRRDNRDFDIKIKHHNDQEQAHDRGHDK